FLVVAAGLADSRMTTTGRNTVQATARCFRFRRKKAFVSTSLKYVSAEGCCPPVVLHEYLLLSLCYRRKIVLSAFRPGLTRFPLFKVSPIAVILGPTVTRGG